MNHWHKPYDNQRGVIMNIARACLKGPFRTLKSHRDTSGYQNTGVCGRQEDKGTSNAEKGSTHPDQILSFP